MAGGIDLWGCMIIVFIIVAGMVVIIKVLLEFPGLLNWKCVYGERSSESSFLPHAPYREDVELGRLRSSTFTVKQNGSSSGSSGKLRELPGSTSSMEMGRRGSQGRARGERRERGREEQAEREVQPERNQGRGNHERERKGNREKERVESFRKERGDRRVRCVDAVTEVEAEVEPVKHLDLLPTSQPLVRQC